MPPRKPPTKPTPSTSASTSASISTSTSNPAKATATATATATTSSNPATTTSTTTSTTTATDPDPINLIKSYLHSQNRPYSATDVSSNLHNKVTKTKTDKLLKELFEKGEVAGRVSGKSWVYWSIQDSKDEATPGELAGLETSIAALREVIPAIKNELKAKMTSLAALCSAPTTEALKESVEGLELQREEINRRLTVLRSGGVKPLSREEREKVEGEHKRWVGKALVRKRIWKEAEGMLLEGMTREELYDKLGIDEEA